MQTVNLENAKVFVTAEFAKLNKNDTLQEYIDEVKSGDYSTDRCKVVEAVTLTAEEYNELTNSFLRDREWLTGKGGHDSDMDQPDGAWWTWGSEKQDEFSSTSYRLVISVYAPERQIIYIDPQGYSYARYVGLHKADIKQDEPKAGLSTFMPEMGGDWDKTATVHARYCGYGRGSYSLKSKTELKPMRGLEFEKVFKSSDLVNVPKAQAYVGWYSYSATPKAFKKLQEMQMISLEMLLD